MDHLSRNKHCRVYSIYIRFAVVHHQTCESSQRRRSHDATQMYARTHTHTHVKWWDRKTSFQSIFSFSFFYFKFLFHHRRECVCMRLMFGTMMIASGRRKLFLHFWSFDGTSRWLVSLPFRHRRLLCIRWNETLVINNIFESLSEFDWKQWMCLCALCACINQSPQNF